MPEDPIVNDEFEKIIIPPELTTTTPTYTTIISTTQPKSTIQISKAANSTVLTVPKLYEQGEYFRKINAFN